jgi:hypothetical protein
VGRIRQVYIVVVRFDKVFDRKAGTIVGMNNFLAVTGDIPFGFGTLIQGFKLAA